MSRRDVVMAGAAALLLALGLLRLSLSDRARFRPLSVQTCWAPGGPIGRGQTVTREAHWVPGADVYVLGWNPWLNAPGDVTFDAELMLYQPDAKATLFVMSQRNVSGAAADNWRTQSLPAGSGYRLQAGQHLVCRYGITNLSAVDFDSGGAGALIYYVPAAGN